MSKIIWSGAVTTTTLGELPEVVVMFDPATGIVERSGAVVLSPVIDRDGFNAGRPPVRLTAHAYDRDVSGLAVEDLLQVPTIASAEADVLRSGPVELTLEGLAVGTEYHFAILGEY